MVLGPLQGPGGISEFPQVKYFFQFLFSLPETLKTYHVYTCIYKIFTYGYKTVFFFFYGFNKL